MVHWHGMLVSFWAETQSIPSFSLSFKEQEEKLSVRKRTISRPGTCWTQSETADSRRERNKYYLSHMHIVFCSLSRRSCIFLNYKNYIVFQLIICRKTIDRKFWAGTNRVSLLPCYFHRLISVMCGDCRSRSSHSPQKPFKADPGKCSEGSFTGAQAE